MGYVKCVACPSSEQCNEEGQCVNTWVTAQDRRGACVRGTHIATGNGNHTQFTIPIVDPVQLAENRPIEKRELKGEWKPSVPVVAGRPAPGTTTGRVWDMADEYAAQQINYGSKEFRREVIRRCEAAGINKSTASVQFGRWISSKS